MTVKDALSAEVYPLKHSTSVKKALRFMTDAQVRHLPIVLDDKLSGIVSETQLEALEDGKTEVGNLVMQNPVSVQAEAHPYEAARLITTHDLTALPVLADADYVGTVTRRDLFVSLVEMLGINRDGAVLVMDVEMRDFSVATIAHLLEQNDVKILSVVSEKPDAEGLIRITLKVNVSDTVRARHVLEVHGFKVAAAHDDPEADAELQERINAFMRYLEV
jgi:acetoin utilization protein AcuB